ncbi:SIR2 family protein [Chryseobacterium sp. APV1]|uniref:SIR2 family protein n=1 Tax=Chryseobacterium urinae TaxID=3058400 RepID=A0ABT8TYW1_9FLAO|nr:SIR2 family protein [Chryseobacterium sp. APV1]MDO3423988.1 SIR2 family protein [Chryseobacterium sp. APV1]
MIRRLKFDEFLRSVSISKDNSFSMLLGAGCSITSDIQSANDCTWEWKKMIYKSNNPNTQEWIENYMNPKVQDSIQNWLDTQGTYIERGHTDEYSFYAKKCFPIDENRRQYFQKICANKTPSIGYRAIPMLVKQGMLDSIWTTNFDDLILTACVHGGITGIDISLETVNRVNQRTQSKNELPVIKLHGDFKYGDLKNTSQELQSQDQTLRNKLIEYLKDKHLIVLGYSGRDKSLMDTLKKSYSEAGAGILFWCGYGDNVNQEVADLLEHIENSGRIAYYINTEGFDITMINLTKLIIEDSLELKREFESIQKITEVSSNKPFNIQLERINKVLKSNLFPIDFPKEVLIAEATLGDKPWDKIKEKTFSDNLVVAAPYGKFIWSFGKAEDIQNLFSEFKIGQLSRKPLIDIKIYNQSISHLLLCSICKIFSFKNNLETNFKNKIWDKAQSINILNHKVYKALKFGLEKIEGKYYLSLNPDFHIENTNIDKEIKQQIGLAFFHKIYNDKFNIYVNDWRKKLLASKVNKLEFPMNSGTGFIFTIHGSPIFTNILDLNNQYSKNHNVPYSLLKLKGVQFKETDLVFSTKNGNKKSFDTHPMRGLINNNPFDTNLHKLLDETINLGVICPEQDSEKFLKFLNMQNQEIPKNNPKDNYIIDFKGFYNIYNISLNIPTINSQNWRTINNPTESDNKKIIHEIKASICDKINKLSTIGSQKIIVIYIPKRWDNYLHYNNGIESFDLHDYIKAFCAEKGITSQIIREKTITDDLLNCQINWWLSLSYFVKSFRTPWVINNTDKNTAFAGIGYSVDNKKDNHKGHIILGCSHIYSSDGEGLKYKLSKINDKIQWINRKPHLSYDDAYEFGRNVLHLFYESMNDVPKRVVIHKRTFFTDDEKRGILDSLLDNKKIENVDLIEINFENNIRYVSSKIVDGEAKIDGFSVSRGTCIQIGNYEALLYAHGIIPSVVNSNFNFYPGGRYIPKPLRIIKHHGNGSLEQIATEILGLTKMNWNSLNMYSQLPATISSSNEIARIGKLIENTEKVQYDYRYFI